METPGEEDQRDGDAQQRSQPAASLPGDRSGAARAMRAHIELGSGEYELYAVAV